MIRAWALFVAALALHVATFALWSRAAPMGSDVDVYKHAALTILHGRPLYGQAVQLEYLWTYTPFAALLMVPLVVLPTSVLIGVGSLVQALLLVPVAGWVWRSLRPGTPLLSPAAVMLAGAALWLEPVWLTVALGQVNLVLLAMVLVDLVRVPGDHRRWSGVLVGVAAGIKLTPLVFVVFLAVVGRRRAAATALAAFAATVGVGFLVLPADSWRYWTRTFFSADRVGPSSTVSNQSLRGALVRAGLDGPGLTLLWLVLGTVVGVVGLLVARQAWRDDEQLLALTLVGMTGAVVSPFSWEHHWVWLLPLLVWLVHRGAYVVAAVGYLLTFAWFVSFPPLGSGPGPLIGLFSLRSWPWLEQVTGNLYLLVFVAALVAVAAITGRDRSWRVDTLTV